MGARESEAMKLARDLILNKGYSQYQAQKECGLSVGAISKAKWYRDFINAKREKGKTSEKPN